MIEPVPISFQREKEYPMKTILRIIVILLVAAIVSGGFYLVANNTSIASGSDMELSQPPTMTGTDGQAFQPPEGGSDHDSASLSRGLAEVGGTLAKLAGITILILLIEKAFSLVSKRKLQPASSQ